MQVWIDGDGCPVTKLAWAICRDAGIDCTILCDTAHEFSFPGANILIVDKGADSVDFAILRRLSPGDLVITQDYGLAALCLSRGGIPIHQDGWVYTSENIDALLTQRQAAAKLRRGGIHCKGTGKRKASQDLAFSENFRKILQNSTQG